MTPQEGVPIELGVLYSLMLLLINGPTVLFSVLEGAI